MKKIIICLIASLACTYVISCRQNGEEEVLKPTLDQITESVTADPDGGHYEILYKLTNPTDDLKIQATSKQDWIGNFTYGESKVAFDVEANPSESERQGTVNISYGDIGLSIPVNQSAKGTEPPSEEYDVDVDCDVFHGGYWGNAYSGDRYGYQVHIATDRSYLDSGIPDIDGVYYTFEMYGPEPEDLNDIFIPEGTYVFDKDNTFGEYTILAGENVDGLIYGTVYYKKEQLHFESGTVVVTRDGSDNICDMDLTATLSDGTVHHAEFRGMDIFIDGSLKWIENDISITNVEYFQATYLTDDYRSANINIKITDAPLTETGYLSYPGNVLTLVGNVELLDNGMPKPGTWTVSSEWDIPDNGLWQGECVRFGSPYPVGVNIVSYDAEGNSTVGLVEMGTVYISGGGDNYRMRWDFTTRNRKKVTGTYTGPIVVNGAPIVDTTLLSEDYELNLDNINVTDCYYSQWNGDLKIDLAYMEPGTAAYIGDNLRIRIIPEEGVKEPLPGTYKVSTTNEPGCVVAGSFSIDNPVWSVYLKFNENGKIIRGASVRDGELVLTKNDDGTWTVDFDFLDDQAEPKRFYGSWTGNLVNLSGTPW